MRVSATKEFTWDCAHFLPGHKGLCKNLHGHTYKLQVKVSSDEAISEGSSAGMVMDFSDLKSIVKELIVDKFDHALIVGDSEDELALRKALKPFNFKILHLQFRTTAEHMSHWMFQILDDTFKEHYPTIRLESISLWETPTSVATTDRGEYNPYPLAIGDE